MDAIAEPLAGYPTEQETSHRTKASVEAEGVLSNQDPSPARGSLERSSTIQPAIDSKLRGCDLVSLKVKDAAQGGSILHRAIVMQQKTSWPVQFELTEQTRVGIDFTNGCKVAFGSASTRQSSDSCASTTRSCWIELALTLPVCQSLRVASIQAEKPDRSWQARLQTPLLVDGFFPTSERVVRYGMCHS